MKEDDIMVNGVLSSSLLEIPQGTRELYDTLRDLAKRRAGQEGVEINM